MNTFHHSDENISLASCLRIREHCGFSEVNMSTTSRVLAVLILAVTIAATTAASAVVRAAVLAGLGVPDNTRLLNIEPLRDLAGRGPVVFFETWPNYLRLRDAKPEPFVDVTCVQQSVIGWDDRGEMRPLQAARVTASFFATVAVPPLLGQPFKAADDGPTPTPVVVISHRVWMSAFAGDREAIGRAIRLSDVPHTVVAVMPPTFAVPVAVDLWLPLGTPAALPSARIFSVYARLRADASIERANAVMAEFTRRTIAEDSVVNRDYRYRARPLVEALVDTAAPAIWLVQAGALLLFVLAVSNVWSLFITWVVERRHETAVRRALGASSRQLVWLFVKRSLAIAVPAGALGALLAWAALPLVRSLQPTPQLGPLLSNASLDFWTMATAIGLTFVAALGIGLVPAWYACRQDAVAGLTATSRGASLSRSAGRFQRAVVLVQSSVAVVVLFAAVVSGVSFWKLAAVPDGFDADGRLIVRVILPESQYPTHDRRALFAARLTEAVAQEPEVAPLAFTTTLPIGDLRWGGRFFPELPNGELAREALTLHFRRVSPGYLAAIGIPLRRGRDFDARDTTTSPPVAIVSRAAADRLWPGVDPIGRRLRRYNVGPDVPPLEVVGIANDTIDAGYNAPPGEAIYVPFSQLSVGQMSIVVRPRTDDVAALAGLRRALKKADPTLALSGIASLESMVSDARAVPRLQMVLLTLFGIVAVSLTALGSYGVMTQLVASRHREFAVRLAVGATPRRLRSMVLGQNAKLAVAGIVLGLVAAWQVGRFLEPIVFGISATSPLALTSVAVTTLLVTLGATILPAARAAAPDVARGLRG
jgi:putative ABC transport system permease protein